MIAVGAWVIFTLSDTTNSPINDQAPVALDGNDGSTGFATPSEPKHNFSAISSTSFDRAAAVLESVQSLESESKQVLNGGFVQSPVDENIYYFITSNTVEVTEDTAAPVSIQTNVYEYDYLNWEWERLYKSTFERQSIEGITANIIPVFWPIGYDDGQLIVLTQPHGDFSPGPCFSSYLDFSTSDSLMHFSLDLDNPLAGLTPYELPEEITEAAEAEQAKCMEETF